MTTVKTAMVTACLLIFFAPVTHGELQTTFTGPDVALYGSSVVFRCSWLADDLVYRILFRVQSGLGNNGSDAAEFMLKNSPTEPHIQLSSDPGAPLQGEVAVDSRNNVATLTLRNLTFAAEGNYTCSISSVTAEKLLSRSLRVIAPPAQIISRLNLSTTNSTFLEDGATIGPYFEGTGFELSCFVAQSRPPAEIRWLRKDTQGRLHPLESQSSPASRQMDSSGSWRVSRALRFRLDSRLLMGNLLICQAENEASSQPVQYSYRLDMLVPPTNISMQTIGKIQALREGTNYNVSCEVRNAKPAATITWTLDRQPVTRFVRNDTISGPDSTLTTRSIFTYNASPDDNGKLLSCIATQEVLTVQRRGMSESTMLSILCKAGIQLQNAGQVLNERFVDSPRNIMTSRAELSVVEFRDADTDLSGGINCTADSSPPSVYSWIRDDQAISNGASLFFNRSMSRDDAGDYYCVASNDIGRTNISFHVNVQYRPYCARCMNSSDPCLIGASVGLPASISCDIDANPRTNLVYMWNANNTVDEATLLQSLDNNRSDLLTVTSTPWLNYTVRSQDDYRRVFCSARNNIGTASLPCYYQIVPAGPPHPPENCSIITVMASGFTLKCRPGFDGGYPQKFLLSIRTVNQPDENGKQAAASPLQTQSTDLLENEYPEWLQKGLLAGRDYQVKIMSRNDAGLSEPVVMNVRTLKMEEGSSALSTTVIAAIAGSLGGFAFLVLLASVAFLCVRRRKKGELCIKQPRNGRPASNAGSETHSNNSSASSGGSKSELVNGKGGSLKQQGKLTKDTTQITSLKYHKNAPKKNELPVAEITYTRAIDLQSKKPSLKPTAAPKPPIINGKPVERTQYAVIDFVKNGKRIAPKPNADPSVHEAIPVTITTDGNVVHEPTHHSLNDGNVIRTVAIV